MLGLDATSQNMGEEKFKFLSSIIKGYINPKNADRYSESLPVVTKSVHELVLGGYLPEIFNKTKAAAKSAGLHMPMNFSILLEVSKLHFVYYSNNNTHAQRCLTLRHTLLLLLGGVYSLTTNACTEKQQHSNARQLDN